MKYKPGGFLSLGTDSILHLGNPRKTKGGRRKMDIYKRRERQAAVAILQKVDKWPSRFYFKHTSAVQEVETKSMGMLNVCWSDQKIKFSQVWRVYEVVQVLWHSRRISNCYGLGLYSRRFRLRSSCCSSSGRSAVSAGFRSEWTLLAMLERRVAGRDDS